MYVDAEHAPCMDNSRSVLGRVIQLAGVVVRGRVPCFDEGREESSTSVYYCQVQQFITPRVDDVPIHIFEDTQGAH